MASNKTFRNSLRGRLRHVIYPLKKEKTTDEKIKSSIKEFESLSQKNQILALTKKARALLLSRGFRLQDPKYPGDRFLVSRSGPKKYQLVRVRAYDRFTMSQSVRDMIGYSFPDPDYDDKVPSYRSVLIVVSLSPVRRKPLASAFPSYSPIGDVAYQGFDKSYDSTVLRTIAVVDKFRYLDNFPESSSKFWRKLD